MIDLENEILAAPRKGDKVNISKADTNALAKRAGGLKAWAKARHVEWLRQIQEH